VFVSPIAKERSPLDILYGWDNIYSSNLSKVNRVLQNIEESNRSKFGPRSIALPWSERKLNLQSSFGIGIDNVTLKPALTYSNFRLRPIDAESAIQYMKNSTNSGLPWVAKKGKIKGALISEWKSQLDKQYPCILFTRTQEGKKTRDVWDPPSCDLLNEMRFYQPLLNLQKKQLWRSALRNPDSVDKCVSNLIKASNEVRFPVVSIDFSKYDTTCKRSLQSVAFEQISNLFQTQFRGEIEYIKWRFNTIGIITPDGIWSGPHGIPSGSTFTNEVDSIIQYTVALNSRYCQLPELCQIQGDDGVYSSNRPEKFIEDFKEVGLEVNDAKSHIEYDWCTYLQSLYHKDYTDNSGIIRGIYPSYRALLRIVYLERFDDFSFADISGKDYFAIRTLTILENCKHHPLFYLLVRYVWQLDKYKLKVSDQGISEYVKLMEYKEGKDIKFSSWSYGGDISGIKSFMSYKIVKELNG